MLPIRTVIVDDEPIARKGIRLELAFDQDIVVIGECRNAGQAVSFIRREKPDLIFLDIQMPKRDGFSVLEELHLGEFPAVVFVTAYDEHALRAFDASAIDYVLKPIDPSRLRRALGKAKTSIQRYRLSLRNRSGRVKHTYLDRVIVRSNDRIDFIDVETIEWIEAADNYVKLHVGAASLLYRDTIKNLENYLNPENFVRIRRSTIVNIHYIKHLQRQENGEFCVVLKGNHQCVTSRRYRKNIRRFRTSRLKKGVVD